MLVTQLSNIWLGSSALRLFINLIFLIILLSLKGGEFAQISSSPSKIPTSVEPNFELVDWDSPVVESSSIAWGDVDNDGDLDLAVGNGSYKTPEPNRLFINENGLLIPSDWEPQEINDITYSVSWGDYDLDGDLDLAIGNGCDPNGNCAHAYNRVYRNDNGQLTNAAVWSSAENNFTLGIAFGDYNGDQYLDLIAGNVDLVNIEGNWVPTGAPNKLYKNTILDQSTPLFSQTTGILPDNANFTTAVSWGDYDNDGDLDLAVGNGEGEILLDLLFPITISLPGPNQLLINENNTFSIALELDQPSDQEFPKLTSSVAWGDYDNDGDLDLAVGNSSLIIKLSNGNIDTSPRGYPNFVYQNNGYDENDNPQLDLVWLSSENDATTSLQWGDFDSDGFLDLAASKYNFRDIRR